MKSSTMLDGFRGFVEGKGTFVDDVTPPGTLHLKVVRSLYPRARLVRVAGGINESELGMNLTPVGEGGAASRAVVPHPSSHPPTLGVSDVWAASTRNTFPSLDVKAAVVTAHLFATTWNYAGSRTITERAEACDG